jgi:hypothetical protein
MRDKNKDSSIDPKSALYYWLEIYNPNDLFVYQARTQPSNPTPQSQLRTGNTVQIGICTHMKDPKTIPVIKTGA